MKNTNKLLVFFFIVGLVGGYIVLTLIEKNRRNADDILFEYAEGNSCNLDVYYVSNGLHNHRNEENLITAKLKDWYLTGIDFASDGTFAVFTGSLNGGRVTGTKTDKEGNTWSWDSPFTISGLFRIDTESGEISPILREENWELQGINYPALSRNNDMVAFEATDYGNEGSGDPEIFVINIDGSGLSQVTHDTDMDMWPAWSFQGITYTTTADDGRGYNINNVFIQKMDDGFEVVEDILIVEGAWQGEWNHAGTHFAYSNGSDLFVLNIESGQTTQLTTNNGSAALGSPSWSPNAEFISFTSNFENTEENNWDIYLVQGNGGSIYHLAGENDLIENHPTFSSNCTEKQS